MQRLFVLADLTLQAYCDFIIILIAIFLMESTVGFRLLQILNHQLGNQ